MLFRTILTLIVLVLSLGVHAQPRGDDVILEMSQAFKRLDRKKLSQLLPQARGHALEPWAAYWELRARLEEAPAQEVQDFFARYAGTYQEDRLRNDWLLLLGTRRDWPGFAAEYPRFRMNDDSQVRCYALLIEHMNGGASRAGLADEVRRLWYAQHEAGEACALAAERLLAEREGTQRLSPPDVWRKARLSMEANRPRAVSRAVTVVAPEAMGMLNEIQASPARFLAGKVIAVTRQRKEIIMLALIKLASSDADAAAYQLENKWGPQLTSEERNWVWGVIGRQVASRLGSDAMAHFDMVRRFAYMSLYMLAWMVGAAVGAGALPRWRGVLSAIDA
ncbi:MAG: lytic transglycosylase domain-containing protein, partial [Burkholderiaceae bacterium]|nr:lytic transglycosylase domain-containing protein [Burkholderiaceae bacterium]